jgi:uncharacterized HAD superfamily protein
VRLAIDIDSTLHHYWGQLEEVVRERFGVELPYDAQDVWEIEALHPDQLRAAVQETHSERWVLSAEPYPGAVDVVRRWHEAGHFIHITSHRAVTAADVTEAWLAKIGLPYDELYCSYDKVTRCAEIGIEVLIDDSPVNLLRAHEAGIRGATILHPWNREVCERHGFLGAETWPELERAIAELAEVGRPL